MIPRAEAKRTLSYVRLATWTVRVISIVNLLAGIFSLATDGGPYVNIGLFISGSAGLTQPLLLSCVYSNEPTPNEQQTSNFKKILYVWLFILNLAVVVCLFVLLQFLFTDESIGVRGVHIVLAFVVCFTCLMLTVINLYTFCILHKNGLCFLYSLNTDVEQTNVSIQIRNESAGITASAPPDETSRILPPSYSVAVSSPEIGSNFYVGNDR